MKQAIQKLLKQAGLYDRVRSSILYDLYWRVFDHSKIDDREREVEFYRSLLVGLSPQSLIFDIGANHGTKTDIFLRLGAKVVSVDPDRTNQDRLTLRFVNNRRKPKVAVVGKAVGPKSGVETMWIDEPGSAKNSLSTKWVETLRTDDTRFGHALAFAQQTTVEMTTVEELIATFGEPLFVKIDVEGYEVGVLEGMRRPVPFLSFEVNLPEFRAEGQECIRRLRELDPGGTFSYAVECGSGLLLPQWLDAQNFSKVLEKCSESSIEIFWRSSSIHARS